MHTTRHPLSPPSLSTLAPIIQSSLLQNFTHASATVQPCPDLTQPPFCLSSPGLSGSPRIADIGGQANLFPTPNFNAKYDLLHVAREMDMSPERGFLIGAGAAPWMDIGHNAELVPDVSWGGDGTSSPEAGAKAKVDGSSSSSSSEEWELEGLNVTNQSHVVEVLHSDSGKISCRESPSTNCALMANLFGSNGESGPVLKVTARSRTGPENFTNCIRKGLYNVYGDSQPISLGGVFLLKKGKAMFHVMPDFPPPEDLPFRDRGVLEKEWLVYQVCQAPVVCCTVFHSADPEGLGLRMEHTHCFDPEGGNKGGHYHYDLDDEEVEYEAYLNVAQVLYRVDSLDGPMKT